MSDITYKSNEALTYSSEVKLSIGTFVRVPIKNKFVNGFIVAIASKPKFITKHIESVLQTARLPFEIIELAQWLLLFYPSSVGITSQQFLPSKLNFIQQNNIEITKLAPIQLPPLTQEQKSALDAIKGRTETYILHGDTGSGKTRIYIELAKKTLRQNKSVIILTPEIGLTPQLAGSFIDIFGMDQVVVTHSKLTKKIRSAAWQQILTAKKPLIVIGPRSALFSPAANVGLIIVDESHEPSYKQDQSPHYLTTRVAAKLSFIHKAILILGSATPSVTDYYYAEVKKKPLLRMKTVAQKQSADLNLSIKVIDMKDRGQFTRSRFISDYLLNEIRHSFEENKQCLLFLNRRGTARTILCNNCGWQAVCPNCDLPLTYHGDEHNIQCHTCGFKQHLLSACPLCNNVQIILKNIGTKFIVDELTTIFPSSNIHRFDADNKKSESLEQKFYELQSGKIDILVGTQILAKGLDLPNLTTVGIINADTSLHFPDYTSSERTYQLLRQVIGRVGRGHQLDNSVVVQTYYPENTILKAAINSDWETFYHSELAERKKFNFPPFCFLLKLTCRRASSKSAEKAAQDLSSKLANSGMHITVDGPSPSFHEKVGDKYQWQLVIKAKNRNDLLTIIASLPSGWSYDIDPLNLL